MNWFIKFLFKRYNTYEFKMLYIDFLHRQGEVIAHVILSLFGWWSIALVHIKQIKAYITAYQPSYSNKLTDIRKKEKRMY